MKRSAAFIPVLHNVSLKLEIESLQMLLRGGFLRQIDHGVYCILPLAKRILSKLEREISNQLESNGAMALSFPTLQIESTKDYAFKIENSPFSLSLNNYSTMQSLIQEVIDSKSTFPLIFFQIDKAYLNDNDFKGVLPTKEYLLNEVYMLHSDEEGIQQTYDQLLNIYKNLLSKLGLHYQIVKGSSSLNENEEEEELIILSELGDETIVYSDKSNYSANIKVAEVGTMDVQQTEMKPLNKVTLENIKDIQDVVEKQSVSIQDCIKSTLYIIDDSYYIVLTRGDHIINETKLKQVLNTNNIQIANTRQIKKVLNCTKGYVGPLKLPLEVKVIADHSVKNMYNAIAGSNEEGIFYENVNPNRDFAINLYEDIRFATEGDLAPNNEGTFHIQKGFKVAHTKKIKLVENLNKPIYVSCFYFGITQLFAILAEKFHDSNGFFWPKEIAPFQISLVVKNIHDFAQQNLADEIYNILSFYRFEVLYDERDETPEKKFIESDLIGLPVQVTVGEKAQEGILDVKIRNSGQTYQFAKQELIDWLTEYFRIE